MRLLDACTRSDFEEFFFTVFNGSVARSIPPVATIPCIYYFMAGASVMLGRSNCDQKVISHKFRTRSDSFVLCDVTVLQVFTCFELCINRRQLLLCRLFLSLCKETVLLSG